MGFGHFSKSLCLLLLSFPLLIFSFLDPSCLLISVIMKKGEISATISGVGTVKAAVEEKAKRASHCMRIEMDSDPKTSKPRDQEAVDRYLASFGFRSNLGIKI